MYKGKVTNFHPKSGAGYIKSKDFSDSVYCHKTLVDKENLKVNDFVEFEAEEGPQGFRVIKINKIKQQNALFELGLKINELSSEDYNKFCNLCRKYVSNYNFKEKISTSKLRNIYSEIIKIQQESESNKVKKIAMLRPKLAYYAGRDKDTAFFMNELERMISEISNPKQVDNLKDFFEAIVCYKKEVGGKK